MLDSKTIEVVKEWIGKDGGDKERTAKWMRDSLRIGEIKVCRELIEEALHESY